MRNETTSKVLKMYRKQLLNQRIGKPHNHVETCKNLKILQQIAIFKDCSRNYARV